MAVGVQDTGEAYKVEVYRFNNLVWSIAKDVYPYYFKRVATFSTRHIKKTITRFIYKIHQTDVQMKASELEQALQSINRALTFPAPYPSKEKMLEFKNNIILKHR